MRKLSIAAVLLASLVVAGCGGKKNNGKLEYVSTPKSEPNDSTIYGVCGEGTMMNTLELVTDSGDTVSISFEEAAMHDNVKGGVTEGDRMAVVPMLDADNNTIAASVINITSLLGKWGNLDRSFELRADGTVVGDMKEPHPYTDWRMLNGRLVLSSDTFSIRSLGPDSLMLCGSKGNAAYRRLAASGKSDMKQNLKQ